MHLLWLLCALMSSSASAGAGDGGIFIVTGNISTRAYVHFIIENDVGQRTGQLLDGTRVSEIPGTSGVYGTEIQDDHRPGVRGIETVHFETSGFPAGHYKLKLLPTATSSYWMRFSIRNDNFSDLELKSRGFALVGATITYVFDFAPTASSPTPAAKILVPGGLRQSVQVALQIGQLGDATFVARLDKLLAKAQGEIDKGQKKQGADRFDEFIHRLDSAFKKEPDPDDGDGPEDRKNAAEMKRFVTKTALESLSADARTLIIDLGEKPKR